jgi:hypothetical protein
MRTGKKRYICSFYKRNSDGIIKPNVVVVAAVNDLIARIKLCQDYGIPNHSLTSKEKAERSREGIKTIRLSETNKYEGELEYENFES